VKYTTKINVEVDTSTNKLVIVSGDKRIAITPVTRGGSDVYAIVNDKPGPQINTAAQMVKWLCQSLIERKHVKKLATETK
jgi:hypothetical protein